MAFVKLHLMLQPSQINGVSAKEKERSWKYKEQGTGATLGSAIMRPLWDADVAYE